MKRVVFIALIISFAFSISISYQQFKNSEIEKLATLEGEFATPFFIPEDELLDKSEEIYPLLLKAATEAQVNLFRSGRYFRPDEQIEMMKYLLLTDETSFFNHIKMKNGLNLQAQETLEGRRFLSTIQTQNENQVGQIQYFDPQQLITVQSLKDSYNHLPVHGRYFAEAKDDKQLHFFLEKLSMEFNSYLNGRGSDEAHYYTSLDFQPPEAFTQPQEGFFILTSLSSLHSEQYILFALTVLLLIYYIFNTSKKVGILKMHGVSNLRLWWIIVGRLINTAVIVTALGSMLFALGLHKPAKFIYQNFIQLGQAYIILIFLSLLCYLYVSTVKVSQTIKNKKDTQGIFVLNMGLKVICAAVLVLMGLQAFEEYADLRIQQGQILAQQEQLDNWGSLEDYGYIEAYVGHTTAYTWEEYEAEMSKDDKVLFELQSFLNTQGALYIDASEYEMESLLRNQNFSGIISIMVNPNYLKAFPVYDREGDPVYISEKTKDWIVLVSEKYKNREKEIRDYFEVEKETRNFYLTNDKGQKMKIIWLAEDQYVFSFNPEVFPAEKNMILDPIIHVKTEANKLFAYRGGIKGRGLTDPLKLKLIDQNPSLTYEKLKMEFKRLQVDDKINIVTFDQHMSQKLDFLYGEIKTSLFSMFGIAGVFIYLVVQNLIIFFHKHQKRFVINRLFGIGFFRTYQSYFIWLVVTLIAFVILSFVMDKERGTQLINGINDPHLLIIVISLLGVETLATVITLTVIERRSKIQVMKGGN